MVDTTATSSKVSTVFRSIALEAQPYLLRRASRLERSHARAWDLVQDTFERALSHFHQFRPGTNPRAWLLSIMTNLFIDRCRLRSRELLSEPSTFSELPTPKPETPALWRSFELDDITVALRRLPPPFQTVLDLHLTRRCSYAEIARHLGIPCNTVGTRLNRARKMMRALLTAPPSSLQARTPPTRTRAPATPPAARRAAAAKTARDRDVSRNHAPRKLAA